MVDTVTTQVLNNGERNLVVKLTSESDGTGESEVTKIDLTEYGCDRVSLLRVDYDIKGMDVELLWNGTPNKRIVKLGPGEGEHDWCFIGGIQNNADNSNGDILLSTGGQPSAGDFYTITLHMKKKYDGQV